MNHSRLASRLTRGARGLACALTLAASAVVAGGCELEAGPDYPVGGYDDYPPDAYIATTTPVYYEGNASYWYGGRWYYRNGGHWNHYDHEPAGLHQRRIAAPPARHAYEGRGGGRGHGGGRR
jgi:hypothetical protein